MNWGRGIIMAGMRVNNKLEVPKFKSEEEERKFWKKVDLSKHFDRSRFKRVSLPNLKPTGVSSKSK